MGDIKTTPILVNMLNELQNQLASKCGRSAVCLYMCVYRCIHISAFVGVCVCVVHQRQEHTTKNQFARYYVYAACNAKRELSFKCRIYIVTGFCLNG